PRPSRAGKALRSVLMCRPPVAVTGCPRAIAPPFTFMRSGFPSTPLSQASGTDAKASLISYRSISSIFMPLRLSASLDDQDARGAVANLTRIGSRQDTALLQQFHAADRLARGVEANAFVDR